MLPTIQKQASKPLVLVCKLTAQSEHQRRKAVMVLAYNTRARRRQRKKRSSTYLVRIVLRDIRDSLNWSPLFCSRELMFCCIGTGTSGETFISKRVRIQSPTQPWYRRLQAAGACPEKIMSLLPLPNLFVVSGRVRKLCTPSSVVRRGLCQPWCCTPKDGLADPP